MWDDLGHPHDSQHRLTCFIERTRAGLAGRLEAIQAHIYTGNDWCDGVPIDKYLVSIGNNVASLP